MRFLKIFKTDYGLKFDTNVRLRSHGNPVKARRRHVTWSVGAAVLLPLPADGRQDRRHVAEQNQRWRQDGLVVIRHDEVVALVFPHQVRYGLHLQVHVTAEERHGQLS